MKKANAIKLISLVSLVCILLSVLTVPIFAEWESETGEGCESESTSQVWQEDDSEFVFETESWGETVKPEIYQRKTADVIVACVELGMTYEEVVEIVGYEGVDIGSGRMIVEFELYGSASLVATFESPKDHEGGKLAWTVDSFAVKGYGGEVIYSSDKPKMTVGQVFDTIRKGMKLSEVEDAIGYGGIDKASGRILMGYGLADGAVLSVWYKSEGKDKLDCVVESFGVKDRDGKIIIDMSAEASGESENTSDNNSLTAEDDSASTEKEYDCQRGCASTTGVGALMIAAVAALAATCTKKRK